MTTTTNARPPLPQYKSSKMVGAAKIVDRVTGYLMLQVGEHTLTQKVEAGWLRKHQPETEVLRRLPGRLRQLLSGRGVRGGLQANRRRRGCSRPADHRRGCTPASTPRAGENQNRITREIAALASQTPAERVAAAYMRPEDAYAKLGTCAWTSSQGTASSARARPKTASMRTRPSSSSRSPRSSATRRFRGSA